MSKSVQVYDVGSEHDGVRLDRYLVDVLPGASRSIVRQLLDDGGVRVRDRRQKKGDHVRQGDRVEVSGYVQPERWSPAPDTTLTIDVIYQDLDLIAVDKPAGVACHPLQPDEKGTVASAMVADFPELTRVGRPRREAGLVHRLDTSTSGVLIFARRRQALSNLVSQMRRNGSAVKVYEALVEGDATSIETIDLPLASRGRKVIALFGDDARRHRGARSAHTVIRPTRRFARFTLVEAEIDAAYRHQIRAHLAAAGHPIAGDYLYGATISSGLERPFLHAKRVSLKSPSTGDSLVIEAPLARDLAARLRELVEADDGQERG